MARVDSLVASGFIVPAGPPSSPPRRVDAGNGCVVDVTQEYLIEGVLEGSLAADLRIHVEGPCGSPPGTFDEEWIALGESHGTVSGSPYSTRLIYTATVRNGNIRGRITLGPELAGQLHIAGRFDPGRLSYSGWIVPPPK